MNRREFLKTGSIGFAALTAGIGAGNIIKNTFSNNEGFSAYAFLPSDKELITDFLMLFKNRIDNINFNNFLAGKEINRLINNRFFYNSENEGLFNNKYFDIKLTKLEHNIKGDIFVSNNSKLVLNPKKDFNRALLNFRENINKKTGSYLLSIEQRDDNFIRNLIFPKNNFITLQNENRVYDKIDISKNYSSVIVPGYIGNTEVEVRNRKINIINSPCRHKLCKIISITSSNTIACVPNKILIKIA